MRRPLWPITSESLQQAFIDQIVQAVLERSDLIDEEGNETDVTETEKPRPAKTE
jgi:hypothetical protein